MSSVQQQIIRRYLEQGIPSTILKDTIRGYEDLLKAPMD